MTSLHGRKVMEGFGRCASNKEMDLIDFSDVYEMLKVELHFWGRVEEGTNDRYLEN